MAAYNQKEEQTKTELQRETFKKVSSRFLVGLLNKVNFDLANNEKPFVTIINNFVSFQFDYLIMAP